MIDVDWHCGMSHLPDVTLLKELAGLPTTQLASVRGPPPSNMCKVLETPAGGGPASSSQFQRASSNPAWVVWGCHPLSSADEEKGLVSQFKTDAVICITNPTADIMWHLAEHWQSAA